MKDKLTMLMILDGFGINENEQGDDGLELKYIVFMRSNDAVFGFDNDVIWHKYVAEKLAKDIETKLDNNSYKFGAP